MGIRSPVFVGRRQELDRLHDWLDKARAGQPRVVLIGGEAGIGKTRLLMEFRTHALASSARWLMGAAADYGLGGLPFGAVVEALRPLYPTGHGLAQLVPQGLAGQRPAGPRSSRAPLPENDRLPQLRMFEELLGRLDRVARERLTVLALEDLHWADSSTREFVAFLARNLGSSSLLVVGTYRSDDLTREHPLQRYLIGHPRGGVERLELTRFGRLEAREQLTAIRGEQVEDGLLDMVHVRSEGNPLFAEELLAVADAGHERSLPPTLSAMLLARVERFSTTGRQLLAALAVADTADEPLLAAVGQLSEQAVIGALREAIDNNIVEAQAGGRYGFRHALLREVIYQDLLGAERRRLHRAVAEFRADPARRESEPEAQLLATLAHHWHQADRPREAFVASWRAAVAAERSFAQTEALLLLERMVGLWQHLDGAALLLGDELARAGQVDTPADLVTILERAAAAADSFDRRRALPLLRAAVAGVDPEVDPDRFARLQIWLSRALGELGDAPGSLDAERAVASVIGRCSALVKAEFAWATADDEFNAGRYAAALGIQVALALARSGEATESRSRLELDLLIAGAIAKAYLGRVGEAMADFDVARAEGRRLGEEGWIVAADKWLGDALQSAARFPEAIDALRRSAEGGYRLGYVWWTHTTEAVLGQALHRAGQWAQADELLARLVEPPVVAWARVVRAYLLVGFGRLAEADQELELAHSSVASSGSSASYGPFYAALAEKALWEADPAAALRSASAGLDLLADTSDLRWVGELSMLGVRAAAELGPAESARAEQLLESLRGAAETGLSEGTIFSSEVRAALASAECELNRLRGNNYPAAWADAADRWAVIPEPYPAAYARYRQAEAALAAGDRRASIPPLRSAFAAAQQLGAAPLRDALMRLAGRARLDLSEAATRSERPFGLTRREQEVLALLARGRTDQQIAEALFISAKTASVHVSNIKAKLGVEHRVEAAAVALKLGSGSG